jgi:heat shock protein HslJ
MKRNLLIVLLLLALFLSSCGILPITKNSGLNGSAWTLTSYNGTALLPETTMTAFFEKGEVTGSASCNHYFGSYTIKGNQIQINNVGWTEMACMNPEGIMEQEQLLMSIFSKTITISIQGEILQLTTPKEDILIFHYLDTGN